MIHHALADLPSPKQPGLGLRNAPLFLPLLTAMWTPRGADAADWDLQPSISLTGLYSDNIRLSAPGSESSGFATSLMPGLDIDHKASRLEVSLRYKMQSLFYVGGDVPSNRIKNFLSANALAEILPENLYVASQANVGQFLTSTTGVFSPNTVFQTGSTTNFQSFRVSPYWAGRIKGYAEGTLGVSYAYVGTGSSNVSSFNTVTGFTTGGNTNVLEEYANFQSGSDLTAVTWRANFVNSEFDSGSSGQNQPGTAATNTRYRNGNGELRYHFSEDYSAFLRAGEYDNRIPGVGGRGSVRNGPYVTAGAEWKPSPKTALQGGGGYNDYFIAAKLEPLTRTMFQLVFRDSRVGGAYGASGGAYGRSLGGYGGLGSMAGGAYAAQVYYPVKIDALGPRANLGTGDTKSLESGLQYSQRLVSPYDQLGGFNAGTTWNALLLHFSPRSVWCGAYQEFTQPFQVLLIYQSSLCQPPLLGGIIGSVGGYSGGVNPLQPGGLGTLQTTGFAGSPLGGFDISQPGLTNQTISRKRGELSIAATTGKSDVGLYGYQENRSFQPTASGQDVFGAAAYWNWQFAARTSTLLGVQWQQIRNKVPAGAQPGSTNDYLMASLILRRQMTPDLDGLLGYQYLQQTSNNSAFRYFQNGVWAALALRF